MAEAPTLPETISFLTQAALLLVTILTLVAWRRKKGPQLADIALLFGSLGVTTVVTWSRAILGELGLPEPAWLATVSGIAFLANPFLMLRVVRQFRAVPVWILVSTAVGAVLSWIYVIYAAATGLKFPPAPGEPSWRVAFAAGSIAIVLAYLILAYCYSAYAFFAGAYRSSGVARRRLNYAAAGTGLFALLFLVAGATIPLAPEHPVRVAVGSVVGGLFLAAIVAFYLGFAPPRALRRAWQLEELYSFSRAATGADVDDRAASALDELKRTALRLTGARRASIVEIRGDLTTAQVLHADGATQVVETKLERGGFIEKALASDRTLVHRGAPQEAEQAKRAGLRGASAENVIAVRIGAKAQQRFLIFPLDRLPFYLDESIEVLEILAAQAATALEAQAYTRHQEELRLREARVAADELRRQNFAMQEATRLKSEFLANMSHELRTPLNGIIGFAELMASGKVGKLEPTHQEFMNDILTSARHLLQLINDVLDLAKVEAGRMEFRPESVEPRKLIEETIVVVRPLSLPKSIALDVQAEDLGTVEIDALRFKQVVYNFVSNAIKFTPEGGKVIVRLAPEGPSKFRIEVQDTGVGIAPQDIPKLFHEFQQLDAGMSKKHQGTGLGLALVKRLVEAQGGNVGVRSVPGQGSTFHAVFPKVGGKAAGTPAGGETQAAGARVLVVDDNDADRRTIASVLAAQGYEVDEAATATNALQLIGSREYDAATLDLILPDGHGYDLLKAIRERANGRHVAVLIVTQLTPDSVHVAHRIDGVFQKPIAARALADALRKAGVGPTSSRPVLVVDDDATVRRLVETHLRTLGYRSVSAADGHEALAAIEREAPSLIVLDLVMPNMDGFAFLDAYRKKGGTAPVIVWTSKDLSREEDARLRGQVQLVVYKAEGGSFSLANRLEEALTRR